MGRFYNGDINGKFMFAIQASDDAKYFGAEEIEQNYIEYCVDDIDAVNEGIKRCRFELGRNEKKLDEFFNKVEYYSDKDVQVYLDISPEDTKRMLKVWARLQLGLKIEKCVREHGDCNFSAEL